MQFAYSFVFCDYEIGSWIMSVPFSDIDGRSLEIQDGTEDSWYLWCRSLNEESMATKVLPNHHQQSTFRLWFGAY